MTVQSGIPGSDPRNQSTETTSRRLKTSSPTWNGADSSSPADQSPETAPRPRKRRVSPPPRLWPPEELPEKLCEACSLLIDRGWRLPRPKHPEGDLLVYEHEAKAECQELARREEAKTVTLTREVTRKLIFKATGLSEYTEITGGERIVTLADYLVAFPDTPETTQGRWLAGKFLDRFPQPGTKVGFTLAGGCGVGKSTLVEALGRSLYDRGVVVSYCFVPDLNNERFADEILLERLKQIGVLILDDLGKEFATEWWTDQFLFPLVKHRARVGKPMVVTTNYDWDTLIRLYSRGGAKTAEYMVNTLLEVAGLARYGPNRSLRKPRWDFAPEE